MKPTRLSLHQRDAIIEAAIEVCYGYRLRFERGTKRTAPGTDTLVGPIDGTVVALEKTILDSPFKHRLTP